MSVQIKLPKSPITKNGNVIFNERISAKRIIELYHRQENIDVEEYFFDREIYILECLDTGYRFYYPFEIIGDQDFYENLQLNSDKKGDGYDRDWADDHQFAAQQIEANDTLLEIGCGSGKFLGRISEITIKVVGLEINSLAADSARKKGFDVRTELVEKYSKENPSAFDTVCAFQVLEHIADVKSFIEGALTLLRPNGKLIFSVPNNEPYFQRFSKYEVLNLPPHHMGLWNLNAFKKLVNHYPMTLAKFEYSGESGVLIDAYLRAKAMAHIKSLPSNLSLTDKLKIYGVAPVALAKSSIDYLSGKKNRAFISVLFRKK